MDSSRFKLLGPIVACATVCLVVGYFAVSTLNEARRSADQSAQLALIEEAERLLDNHRAEHGHYPKSLDALAFTFPDGGDTSTLARLEYESDGETYSLVTEGVYTGKKYRTSR